MALPLLSTEPGQPGIIAVGGDAIGVLAIGVSATGLIAIGVQARGLIALSCGVSVGALAVSFGASVGLMAMSVGFAGGLAGGAYGVELPVLPGPFPRRLKDTGEGSLDDLQPGESRWLRVTLVREGGKCAVMHKGKRLPDPQPADALAGASPGPARLLLKLGTRDTAGETDYPGASEQEPRLEVLRLEPLTTLARARLRWLASLAVRLLVLAAIGWFLTRR